MKTFGPSKPSRLKALRVSGGFTNRAPSIRTPVPRKPRVPNIRVKKGMTILPQSMQATGNRVTEIPSMKLYLDLDPYDDHHGHGFWAGKFDPDKKQHDYEPSEQDMGKPQLSVSHHFGSADEVEDETIKSFRVSPSERISPALHVREPQALRKLHRKRTGVRSKINFKVLGRYHRHPSVIIRTKRKMPQTKPHIFRRMRRVRAPR